MHGVGVGGVILALSLYMIDAVAWMVCVRPSHLPNPATLGHGVHLI